MDAQFHAAQAAFAVGDVERLEALLNAPDMLNLS
jgi:hypothetical protein